MFVVRKGNPKGSRTGTIWSSRASQVITPNPKTSGGARWNYLAAWGYALAEARRRRGQGARSSSRKLYKNVPVLDSGARGSTTTFAQRGIGDVLIAWENEALLLAERARQGQVRDRRPRRVSILAEPPVAVVDKNVDKHGTRAVAEAYLKFLYTDEGQELAAKHYYRPRNAAIAAKHPATFPKVKLFTIDESFGGWKKAQKTHFDDGGVFDQIYQPASDERRPDEPRLSEPHEARSGR